MAKNLERLLKERGWNVRDLARAAKMSPTTIYSILNPAPEYAGEPRSDTLSKIADALNVPEGELAGRKAPSVEEILREFESSRQAASLDPSFGDRDKDHLRQEGRYTWSKVRPTPSDVRRLVIFFRRLYKEEDRSE